MLLLLTPFAHALRHAWATPPALHEGRRYAFMTCLNSVYGVLYNTHTHLVEALQAGRGVPVHYPAAQQHVVGALGTAKVGRADQL